MQAIPARGTVRTVRQPDGTELRIVVAGDEFCKIVRTEDGFAVTQDADGYWCYASYDIGGAKRSSGVRVTPFNRATAAAAAARNIPYGTLRAGAAERRAVANRARSAHRFQPAAKAGNTTKKALIVLAQFTNLKFNFDREYFVDMLTKHGYSYAGATGSALDYFNDQFEGAADFEFTVSSVVDLAKEYRYYGENDANGDDKRAYEVILESCRALDDEIDFSQFDCDGDGEVDNIFVFVPGHDEAHGASSTHIWSHQWYIWDGLHISEFHDGKRINSYAITTELTYDSSWKEAFASIGTFCHEYSHSLGLYDLYDTDYEDSGGEFNAVWGTTSLMDNGNYNNNGNTPPNYNSLELWMLGLGKAEPFALGSQTLAPLSSQKRYFISETDNENELYFFECRTTEGWDTYVGGSGMLIYHYDASSNDAGYSDNAKKNLTAEERWWNNEANANPDHPCFDLIEAIPIARDIAQVFWPNGTHTTFNGSSTPAMTYWSGGLAEIGLNNIKKEGTFVSFSIVGPVTIEKIEEFQDAAIVLWSMTGPADAESGISIKEAGGNATEYRVKPYAPGSYSYTFEGLTPERTYTVTVFPPESRENSVSADFTTKKYYSDGFPFIYLNSAKRNSDGTFQKGGQMPLRVFNARGAARVRWSFPENCLTTDGSGYYTVQNTCQLKAIVDYEDGTTDVITKQITVK
jgi:M6 family metalloprotease-like protein